MIEKNIEKLSVKKLNGNMKCKEYEIKIELFYEGEDEDKTTLKLLYSTLHNSFYKLKYGLAERKGFEPSIQIASYTHFPGARLRPLGHLSVN